jgi:hypothetical protein
LSSGGVNTARFELQLVAQSTLYNTHAQGGWVSFSNVRVSLPTIRVRG